MNSLQEYNKKYLKFLMNHRNHREEGVIYKCIKCKQIWNSNDEGVDDEIHETMKCKECRLKLLDEYRKTLGLSREYCYFHE